MHCSRVRFFFVLVLAFFAAATASYAQNTIFFDKTSYTVNENAGSANIIVRLTRGDSNTVTVSYSTADGTAMAGSDYQATSGTLTFASNETAKLIQVPLIDDLTAESNETFTVTLTNATAATISGGPATATIQDNDGSSTTIGFSADNYTVNENGGSVTITVTRSGVTTGTDSVNYTTTPGSATDGVDYQGTSGTLTFGPGVMSQTFSVPILDDSAVEGNETFAVNLSSQGGQYAFNRSTATVTIIDNETSTVNFSAAIYSVSENGGNATITLLRTGNTNSAARVMVSTVGGTATADKDYASISSRNVDFAQGQTSASFDVPIFDDSGVEGTESFYISLTASPNSGVSIPGGSSTAEVRIIDNESANTVEFAGTDFSVNEKSSSAAITVRLNRSGDQNQSVSVQYFTETGSATPGQDYTPVSGVLTFGPGETIKTFSVPILNDSLVENTETVGLILSNPTNATLGTNSAATLSIIDDDSSGTVQFSSSNYFVSEASGRIALTVLLNRIGGSNDEVTVDYTTVAGSAAEAPTSNDEGRYIRKSGTITFAPGSALATIEVEIKNDALVEAPQNFFVVLSNPKKASLGSPSTTAVTIQDDDGLNSIEFDAADYGVVETDGVVQVRLRARRGGDPNQVLTVDLGLGATGDTAFLGTDYGAPSSTTVTFAPGISVLTVSIPIANHPEPQGLKIFTVRLTNPGPFTSIGLQSSSRVTIFDNFGPNTVQLLSGAQRFREGDQAVIAVTVVRFGDFNANGTTVNYTTELRPGDTAHEGVNFTQSTGSIFFARIVDSDGNTVGNETLRTILIPIPNNTLVEGDVTFHLTLTSSDVAQLGSISTTQITITDDDLGNVVQFTSPTYGVAEAAGNAVITVKLTPNGDPSKASSVNYVATQISAFAGFDFSPVSGTLTFAPGETSKTILVPINNDDIAEDSETFRVTLNNPSPGTIVGAQSSAIVTIADDDAGKVKPTFQFSNSAQTVNNSAGSVAIPVTLLRNDTSGTYSVNFATSDISAISGTDYIASSGTLVFGPGEVTKNIVVSLISQPVGQPTRLFKVTLSNPSNGAQLGDISEITISIINPDTATKVLNVSTRGPVEQGNDVMIAGFIIQGSATKQLVLRGRGPSLAQFGVPSTINDPTLTLMNANGDQIAFNDDFGTNSQSDQTILTTNSMTPSDSREAALVVNLAPGSYTAILRGKTNGVGLIEVFDLSSTAASALANISTRGKVEKTDNGAMIAGFIIAAPPGQTGTATRVVVRATGPSLQSAGIGNALADTTLDLYRGSQLILSNDNWKTNSSASQAELNSLGLAPKNDKEAAIITNLDPGSYSAVVRGKNDTVGVALVEVYRINQ